MWISKMISKDNKEQKAEKGSVTLSNASLEAEATVKTRDISSYAPYGYQAKMPVGEEVMLLPSSDGQVVIGSKATNPNLEGGEIRLRSLGGATIVLKNDGSVVINSLVIDKNGVIKN